MSLIEVLLATTIAAGIAVTIGHVVREMTTGATNLERRAQVQTELSLAMVSLRSEVRLATTVKCETVGTSGARITFEHPDLTGDNTADTVIYEWSGQSGDPLTRQINSGTAETILADCAKFSASPAGVACRLTAGQRYDIRMDYYEKVTSAKAVLSWSSASQAKQVIPTSCLYPVCGAASGIGLDGYYYTYTTTPDFTNLALYRRDLTINFDWGTGRPDSSVSYDQFCVRWLGQVCPAYSEVYTFYTTSNDGVRLWVNNQLLIDNWTDHSATEDSGTGMDLLNIRLEVTTRTGPLRLETAVQLVNRPVVGG